MMQAYYLIDSARSGLENMAIDQTMLEQTNRDRRPRVRFYQWSQPTVSLGYFQKYSEFIDFGRQRMLTGQESNGNPLPLKVVRRATGGGAIVHHFDWTYCIALPLSNETDRNSVGASCQLYNEVHRAVIVWLNQKLGDSEQLATMWSSSPTPPVSNGWGKLSGCSASNSTSPDFLCFNRRSAGDIVIGRNKLMGSAQRRHQSSIMQHGSLLLAASSFASELAGLQELTETNGVFELGNSWLFADFAESIVGHLADCYHFHSEQWDSRLPFVANDPEIIKRLESWKWLARI